MKKCFWVLALLVGTASSAVVPNEFSVDALSASDIFNYMERIVDSETVSTLLHDPAQSMADLVMSQGYPLEEHQVTTKDGYILTVFRIPYGINSTTAVPSRSPIILQHGIFATSASWVISIPEKGLGFVLADAGYDVWLPNSRGSTYSRKHIHLDPVKDKAEFFNFSWHEMGFYDQPAIIDYILEKTNNTKLTYAGHSQGTTQFFVLTSCHPEYNAKIKVAALMAPIAYLDHARGTVKMLTAFSGWLSKLSKLMGIYEVLANSPLIHYFDTSMCKKTAFTISACDNLLYALAGFDRAQFNQTLMPIIADQGPSGASVKQLIHFGQEARGNEKFIMFDYGWSGNMKEYGQPEPPEYDFSKITVPIHLHYSLNDWLAGVADVQRIQSHLANSRMIEVPFPSFNHLDFMWAKDVRTLLYDDMIKLLKRYI